jgi:hypothetical protein
MDYSPLSSAFKMKAKNIRITVMRPLFVHNFIFEPLFVHVPDIVHFLIKYVDIVNAELIESTLKQTIMCT